MDTYKSKLIRNSLSNSNTFALCFQRPSVFMIQVFLLIFVFFFPIVVSSQTYEVGPAKPYQNIGDVPWENLGAGDQVFIYWREQPYREKWVIAVQATESQPLVISGVPNQNGELPVINGINATTRSQLNYWNEGRGIIKVGGSNVPSDVLPTWITIENLDIRSGRTPYTFSGRDGLSDYSDNCAAIFIEKGEHIAIRNCVLRDCGNGLFSAHASKEVLVEGCWIYDNGIKDSIYQHNNYTETFGITFQYNLFGPLRTDCPGNNLKDRSAGAVIRYNWIESGNRQLDLVDSSYASFYNDPLYRKTFVYGNILIEPEGAGNSQIVHYGGDSGNQQRYRKGTLHFYNNTVVSKRTGNTTLLRLSSNDESCDCRNNILYVAAEGTRLAMLNSSGVLNLRNNWMKTGWRDSHGTLTGEINDHGGILTGDVPGFEDAGNKDYRLNSESICIEKGTSLHSAVLPENDLTRQYLKHRESEPRQSGRLLDMGALEPAELKPSVPKSLKIEKIVW